MLSWLKRRKINCLLQVFLVCFCLTHDVTFARQPFGLVVVPDWPVYPNGSPIGAAIAVAVDSHNHVYVLHQATREASTRGNYGGQRPPSSDDFIYVFDGDSGKLLTTLGRTILVNPVNLRLDDDDNLIVYDRALNSQVVFNHQNLGFESGVINTPEIQVEKKQMYTSAVEPLLNRTQVIPFAVDKATVIPLPDREKGETRSEVPYENAHNNPAKTFSSKHRREMTNGNNDKTYSTKSIHPQQTNLIPGHSGYSYQVKESYGSALTQSNVDGNLSEGDNIGADNSRQDAIKGWSAAGLPINGSVVIAPESAGGGYTPFLFFDVFGNIEGTSTLLSNTKQTYPYPQTHTVTYPRSSIVYKIEATSGLVRKYSTRNE